MTSPVLRALLVGLPWLLLAVPDPAPQEDAERTHGWLAHHAGGGRGTRTIAPVAGFAVPAGQSIHAEVGARDWDARYTSSVLIPVPGRFRFGLEAEGGWAELSVTDDEGRLLTFLRGVVDGAPQFTDWVELEEGSVSLLVRFRRRDDVACRLRTLWEQQPDGEYGFRAEPIPSFATRLPVGSDEQETYDRARLTGRVLLENKGCTACHAPSAAAAPAVGVRSAPNLAGVGRRASSAWIERWIRAPHELRPGADMPAVLPPATADVEAAALAAFLVSLAPPDSAPEAVATEPAVLDAGRRLYHTVGCVACHGPLESAAEVFDNDVLGDQLPAADVRAPFGDLEGKWRPAALAAFLRDPSGVLPDGRMPELGLDDAETDLLATYLVTRWGAAQAEPPSDPALVERGRALFTERRCVSCHALDGLAPVAAESAAKGTQFLEPTGGGCLDPADVATPRYDLSADDTTALRAGLDALLASAGVASPIDDARRTFERLNCGACHQRDGAGGVGAELDAYFVSAADDVDLGDDGRLAPELSGVGAKLTNAWLTELLTADGRARPYLALRMPNYQEAHVAELPAAFAHRAGVWPGSDAEPIVDDERVRTGRELMGRQALGCVACHVYADYPPNGTPGLAMTQFAERLRLEWYRSYVASPQRYKPGGRMPDFGGGGKSMLTSVYDGDMARQADAMWAYFTLGEFMPVPDGVEKAKSLRVDVGARPVVLRSFLENAGSRGIAVGTPSGMHYSFDAEGVRLADAWKGDFLDAAGSWAGRGGTVLSGHGPGVWTAPPGPALALGARPATWPTSDEAELRFGGYRLDAGGYPTFLYWQGAHRVEERVDVVLVPHPAITRVLSLTPAPTSSVWLRAGPGRHEVSAEGADVVQHGAGEDGLALYELLPRTGTDGPLTVRVTQGLE
jgi:mono/diheme cytochrome c family protein